MEQVNNTQAKLNLLNLAGIFIADKELAVVIIN